MSDIFSVFFRCVNLDGIYRILRWIFKKWDGGAWTGLIWLRIGTGGRLL
jgi:hypothetical protein